MQKNSPGQEMRTAFSYERTDKEPVGDWILWDRNRTETPWEIPCCVLWMLSKVCPVAVETRHLATRRRNVIVEMRVPEQKRDIGGTNVKPRTFFILVWTTNVF
ncbi:protein LIAT1 isoform X2 [Lates calcarifer]|uniref:Protein LIAT1 isoform X2 n=1 Tax=Lates calcarifer TaxID=8187 RepID=A0AAJ8DXG4_LATCA|nr:protein LIAT1 isoform X2 [Lates calcarifer]